MKKAKIEVTDDEDMANGKLSEENIHDGTKWINKIWMRNRHVDWIHRT